MCGVCFGTGLRNVRGLLRRPEATALVQKMQHGELRPGASRGRECVCLDNLSLVTEWWLESTVVQVCSMRVADFHCLL